MKYLSLIINSYKLFSLQYVKILPEDADYKKLEYLQNSERLTIINKKSLIHKYIINHWRNS